MLLADLNQVLLNVLAALIIGFFVEERLKLFRLRREFEDALLRVLVTAVRLRDLGDHQTDDLPGGLRLEADRLTAQLNTSTLDLYDHPGGLTYPGQQLHLIVPRVSSARGVVLSERSTFGKAAAVVEIVEPLRDYLLAPVWRVRHRFRAKWALRDGAVDEWAPQAGWLPRSGP